MIRIICLKCCTFMFYLKVFRKKQITFRCSRYQECRVNPITLKSCEILFNKQWILKNKNFIEFMVPVFVFVFAFIFVFVSVSVFAFVFTAWDWEWDPISHACFLSLHIKLRNICTSCSEQISHLIFNGFHLSAFVYL